MQDGAGNFLRSSSTCHKSYETAHTIFLVWPRDIIPWMMCNDSSIIEGCHIWILLFVPSSSHSLGAAIMLYHLQQHVAPKSNPFDELTWNSLFSVILFLLLCLSHKVCCQEKRSTSTMVWCLGLVWWQWRQKNAWNYIFRALYLFFWKFWYLCIIAANTRTHIPKLHCYLQQAFMISGEMTCLHLSESSCHTIQKALINHHPAPS